MFRGVLSLLRVAKMIRGRVRDGLGLGKWMASGLQSMRVGEGGDIFLTLVWVSKS